MNEYLEPLVTAFGLFLTIMMLGGMILATTRRLEVRLTSMIDGVDKRLTGMIDRLDGRVEKLDDRVYALAARLGPTLEERADPPPAPRPIRNGTDHSKG